MEGGNIYNKKTKKSVLYLLPLFILILNQSINTFAFYNSRTVSQLTYQDDSSQLVVRGGAYLISIIFLLINFKENYKVLIDKKIFLLFIVFFICSVLWSGFPIKVIVNSGHLLGMTLVLLAARIFFVRQLDKTFPVLSVFFAISLIISTIFVVVFPDIGVNHDGRWQGATGNANTLGALAICSIWASLSTVYTRSKGRGIFYVFLIMSVVILLETGSKTSLIVAIVICMSVFVLVSQESGSNLKRFSVLGLWACAGLIVLLLIIIAIPEVLGLKGFMNALGRDTTFSGRTKVWEHGWRLFLKHPDIGWGFDSTMSVIKYTGGRLGQFHNGYIDLLVRGGVVGLTFVILLVFSLVGNLLRRIDSEVRIRLLFLSLIIGVLVHNISEASLVKGTNLFWMLTVFSYLLFDKKKIGISK
jgi:exopolysaccharide production protein ExoQ